MTYSLYIFRHADFVVDLIAKWNYIYWDLYCWVCGLHMMLLFGRALVPFGASFDSLIPMRTADCGLWLCYLIRTSLPDMARLAANGPS